MRIILIYDVSEIKCGKVQKMCNKYLNRVQNSVFEGDITKSKLIELKLKLSKIINEKLDSIIIYVINNPKWIQKEILGVEKNGITNFI